MFSKILLPIDLSHEASWRKAAPIALGLLDEGGELHVLSVLPDYGEPMVSSYFPPDVLERATEEVKAQLHGFIDANAPGATAHLARGHVAEAIVGCAEKVGADLIVMASHPPDDLRSFLIGSQAEKVVRHSPVPVFVSR